jgi:hypothetical protein
VRREPPRKRRFVDGGEARGLEGARVRLERAAEPNRECVLLERRARGPEAPVQRVEDEDVLRRERAAAGGVGGLVPAAIVPAGKRAADARRLRGTARRAESHRRGGIRARERARGGGEGGRAEAWVGGERGRDRACGAERESQEQHPTPPSMLSRSNGPPSTHARICQRTSLAAKLSSAASSMRTCVEDATTRAHVERTVWGKDGMGGSRNARRSQRRSLTSDSSTERRQLPQGLRAARKSFVQDVKVLTQGSRS